jgi:excisionase family DNA binding protein
MMVISGAILRVVDGEKLLTIPKAAEYLGVSHMTIRRYIRDDRLHPIKPGRDYLIERDELEQFKKPSPGRPRKPSPQQ